MGIAFYRQGREHEFHGPRNGVFPANYPQVYGELLTYYCIKSYSAAGRTRHHVICRSCYYALHPLDQDRYKYSARHYICNHSSLTRAAFCNYCGTRVATISPAGTCSECIEEYFTLSSTNRNRLARGRLIRVNRRWQY
jgi:hypothetical protein